GRGGEHVGRVALGGLGSGGRREGLRRGAGDLHGRRRLRRADQVAAAGDDDLLADENLVRRPQIVGLHDGLGSHVVFAGDGVERLAAGDGVRIAVAVGGRRCLDGNGAVDGQRRARRGGAEGHGGRGDGRRRG